MARCPRGTARRKICTKCNSTLFNMRLGLRLIRSSVTGCLAQQSHEVLYRSCLSSSGRKNGTINLFLIHDAIARVENCDWASQNRLKPSILHYTLGTLFMSHKQWLEGFVLPFWRVDTKEEYLSYWVEYITSYGRCHHKVSLSELALIFSSSQMFNGLAMFTCLFLELPERVVLLKPRLEMCSQG